MVWEHWTDMKKNETGLLSYPPRQNSTQSGLKTWNHKIYRRERFFLYLAPKAKAAAAAKSLQSCPTPCNPIDGSPPGSPVSGTLQARTLESVAISFSNAWKWKVKVKSPSRAKATKPKIKMLDYIKLKSFCISRETISRIKREPMRWEKIFENNWTNEGLIYLKKNFYGCIVDLQCWVSINCATKESVTPHRPLQSIE